MDVGCEVASVGWKRGCVEGPRLSSSRIQDLDIQSEYASTFDRYVETKARKRKG